MTFLVCPLVQGCAMEMGTFDELAEHGVDFAALLKRDEEEEEESPESPIPNGKVRKISME